MRLELALPLADLVAFWWSTTGIALVAEPEVFFFELVGGWSLGFKPPSDLGACFSGAMAVNEFAW